MTKPSVPVALPPLFTDRIVIDRLNAIAGLYDELSLGQDASQTDRD